MRELKDRPFAIAFPNQGRTKQSETEGTDIKRIVRLYEKTGQINHVNRMPPAYGDFSNVGTYHDGMLVIQEANRLFMEQPAELRKRFHNNAMELVEFLEDPQNIAEAVELGLAEITEDPAPVSVRVIEPTGPEVGGETPPPGGGETGGNTP